LSYAGTLPLAAYNTNNENVELKQVGQVLKIDS